MTTLDELQATHAALAKARAAQLQQRFDKLLDLRRRCDDELLVLADEIEGFGLPRTRRSPKAIPPCGTESAYQRHRHRGEDCEECKAAHRDHERIASARRRLQRIARVA